jgi:hypothetical protein
MQMNSSLVGAHCSCQSCVTDLENLDSLQLH